MMFNILILILMSKKANLNSVPALNNQTGFRLHDLSHYFGFKCSTGHIVDLEHDILNPGERIRLKADMFIRMQPLVTPAMVDIDVDIHYFFVPMTMLDGAFGRNWSKTREIYSTAFSSNIALNRTDLLNTQIPTGIGLFRDKITDVESLGLSSSNNQECLGSRVFRQFDYMGFNPFNAFVGTFELEPTPPGPNPIVDDEGTTLYSYTDYADSFNPYFWPYPFLAYNAIWQYWYRLEDRDQFTNRFFNIDHYYQSGSSRQVPMPNLFGSMDAAVEAMAIKYAPRKKDYFTSVFRAPVISNLNFLNTALTSNENEQYLLDRDSYSYSYQDTFGQNNGFTLDPIASVGSEKESAEYSLSTQQLRIMQAKEKYLNILGRLPRKNYDNLAYALFGEKVPHDVKHELSHLGHDSFSINIGQVTSLADTGAQDGAPLGELAGTGRGVSRSHGIKFTAPVHGVVMALMSIVPRFMYFGGILRHNMVASMSDLFNPVYDNLGMQPVYGYEIGQVGVSHEWHVNNPNYDKPNSIVGWQFRYEQFKRRPDRVNMAFTFGTERSWFNTIPPLYLFGSNAANTPVDEVDSMQTTYVTPYNQFFYCSPTALNEIMGIQYQPDWVENWLHATDYENGKRQSDYENWLVNPELIYARDPFICLAHIDYKKFSKMSSYGLVQFD